VSDSTRKVAKYPEQTKGDVLGAWCQIREVPKTGLAGDAGMITRHVSE
jgi:hypothetical protein